MGGAEELSDVPIYFQRREGFEIDGLEYSIQFRWRHRNGNQSVADLGEEWVTEAS